MTDALREIRAVCARRSSNLRARITQARAAWLESDARLKAARSERSTNHELIHALEDMTGIEQLVYLQLEGLARCLDAVARGRRAFL